MSSHETVCAALRNYQSDSRPPYSSFHSTPSGHVPLAHQCVPALISPNNGRRDSYKNVPRRLRQNVGPQQRDNINTSRMNSNIPLTIPSPYSNLPPSRRAHNISKPWYPYTVAIDPASSIPSISGRAVGRERTIRKEMDDYSKHPCRLVRIMGPRILADVSIEKSTTGSPMLIDDIIFNSLPNVIVADSRAELSHEFFETSSAPQYTDPPPFIPIVKKRGNAPHFLAPSPPLIPIGMKRERRPVDTPSSLPPAIVYAQTVVHSPRPQRYYQTAPFLLEEQYASNGSSDNNSVSWIPKDREKARLYRDQQEEQTMLNSSLLLSEQATEPEFPNVPLWSSISPSILEIPSCEFSSSTSAYHTFLGGGEPRVTTPENTERTLARSELAQGSSPLSPVGSRRPAATFASPMSDDTLATSSSGLSASLMTPVTVGQDLQTYTEHMVSQIFKVRGLAEVMSSSWMVAMQAEFLTCQKIMATGG